MSDRVDPQSSSWNIGPSAYLAAREAPFSVSTVPLSLYVTMRDGCGIATDVYLPQGAPEGSTFPTIIIFTPYYRRFVTDGTLPEAAPAAARYRDLFVPRGYAVVVVDIRGTGASFGTRDALRSPTERLDFHEIAEWIAAQTWSNQVIGATGISYVGAAALFLASTQHPAVKAIAPLFSVSDIYSEQLFPGGLLAKTWTDNYDALMLAMDQDRRDLIKNFSYYTDPGLQGPHPVDADADGKLMAAALQQHVANFSLNDASPEFTFRGEGMLYDPSFSLDVCSPYYYLDQIPADLPIYSVSGWFDGAGYANGAITRYLTRNNPNDRLLLGPWDHGARTNVSPWRSVPVPEFDMMAEVLRFFDEHLMQRKTGLSDEAPIHYFSIHSEQWQAAQSWPPLPIAESETWHMGAGTLLTAPEPDKNSLSYQVDFSTTTGRNTRSERLGAKNIIDYYPDWRENREKMFNFTGAPLSEAMTLTGHAIATLSLRFSEADASLFVFLSEVEASGEVRYITEGLLRVLHRKTSACPENYLTSWPFRSYTREDAAPVEKGQVQQIVIPFLPISWTLSAGSRLGFSIAGADKGHYAPHPYGRPPLLELLFGGTDGSTLTLPLQRGTTPSGRA